MRKIFGQKKANDSMRQKVKYLESEVARLKEENKTLYRFCNYLTQGGQK